jgi:hypothetical protein
MRQSVNKKREEEKNNERFKFPQKNIPKLYTSLGSAKDISSIQISDAVQYNEPKSGIKSQRFHSLSK